MRSVRLDPNLEAKLARAAKASGEPASTIIRRGIERQCADILGQGLQARLADVVGIVRGGGGRARRTGDAFRELLAKRRRR